MRNFQRAARWCGLDEAAEAGPSNEMPRWRGLDEAAGAGQENEKLGMGGALAMRGHALSSRARHLSFRCLLLLAIATLILSGVTHAAAQNWDAGVNSNWDTTTANWSGAVWTNNNDAVFGTTGSGTVNLGTGVTANSLTFNSTGYTISGGTLGLTGAADITTTADSLVSAALTGSAGLTKNGAGTLTLSGTSTYTGNTNLTVGMLDVTGQIYNGGGWSDVVTIGSGSTLRIYGLGTSGHVDSLGWLGGGNANLVIDGGTFEYAGALQSYAARPFSVGAGGATLKASQASQTWYLVNGVTNNTILTLEGAASGDIQGVISGTGALIKNGSGTWILEYANSYTGATNVNDGTLRLNGATANLGTNSALTLANTAGVELYNGYWNGTTEVGSDFSVGSLAGGGNLGGNVDLWPCTMTIGTDNTSTTFGGAINNYGDPASITKVGSGTLTLTCSNTYAGTTTISGGTLQLGDGTSGHDGSLACANIVNNSNLVYNLSAEAAYIGNIAGTGGLTKSGAGTLTLTGSNTYSGTTSVSAGTLCVNGTIGSPAALTVAAGATLSGTGTIASPVTVASGATVTLGDGKGNHGMLRVSGTLAISGGATLNFGLKNVGISDVLQLTGGYVAPASPVTVNILCPVDFTTWPSFSNYNYGMCGGTYYLITGAAGISASSYVLGSTPTGYTYALSASNGTLSVTVTPTTAPIGLPGAAATMDGGAFSYQIALVNNPTGYAVTGLPAGLSLNTSTGLITGTVATPGIYYATVSATNSGGAASSQLLIAATPATPFVNSSNNPPVLLSSSGASMTVQPVLDNTLLINPGKGFASYKVSPSYGPNVYAVGHNGFCWADLETAEGVYDWSKIDDSIAAFARAGMKICFGVANYSTGTYTQSATPPWVFEAGVASTQVPDSSSPTGYTLVPTSWEDPIFLAKMKAFIAAFGARYNGHPNIEHVYIYDYGDWGELGANPSPDVTPAQLVADFYQPYFDAFPNTQLVINSNSSNFWGDASAWATAKGAGAIRCSMAAVWSLQGAEDLVAYPHGPGVLEYGWDWATMNDPNNLIDPNSGLPWSSPGEYLMYVTGARASYAALFPEFYDANPAFCQMAGNILGYHFVIQQATIPTSIQANVPFPMSLTWLNNGVAPLYNPCRVAAAVLDANNNVVQKQWLTTSNPKGWMPGTTTTENYNVTFPSVPSGYRLAVGLFVNQSDTNPTYRLGIQGRTVTGWYILTDTVNQAAATWANASDASWQTAGNWTGSSYTNGVDASVDFSTLNLTSDATVTLDGNVTAGNLVFGDTDSSNNWTVGSGTGGALTLMSSSNNGEPVITVNNQTVTISSPVFNSLGLAKNGSGTLALTGTSAMDGNIDINGGVLDATVGILFNAYPQYASPIISVNAGAVLQLAGSNAFGWGVNPGISCLDIGAASLVINGGTINFTGTAATGGGRDFTIGPLGATFQSSQSGGALTIAGGYTQSQAPGGIVTNNSSLTLAGNGTGGAIFQSNITGTGTLTKTGNGTWTLTGSNTYSGATSVTAGTLGISQSNSTSSLAVAAGATLALGGANGSPGPLVLSGALALGGGSNLNIVLGSRASDSIQISGTYVAPVGTVYINLSSNQGGLSAGTYNLITGATGISAANFALGSAPTGYGYALSASNGTLSLTVEPPPSQPTGLNATGSNASVVLGWTAASGSVSYNIKRSPTSGSGYVTIASGVTAPAYTDDSVSNGTTYYYVVSAVNVAGESPNSTQASAMPVGVGTLPTPPWAKIDVGSPALTGSSVYDGGSTFTVTGAGGGIGGSADSCQFAYVTTTASTTTITVIARVATPPTGSTQVGLMMRSGTTNNAKMAAVILSPSGSSYQAQFGYRRNSSVTWVPPASTGLAVPLWLKLTREGNTYTGFISSDGVAWTPIGSYSSSSIIASGATAYCGLVVSSKIPGSLASGTFDNVSVPGWTAPPLAPDGVTASAASQTQINLGWNAVSGATGYQVWRSNSWGGSYSQIGTPATAGYQDSGLSAGTTYYYMVRATSGNGSSGNSTVATATTPPNPPVITSGLSATGTTGTAFTYQISGSNIPTSFSATNLPTGLAVDIGTGVISGTPTATGTTNVTIGATNAGGTGSATLVITVLPPPPAAPAGFTATAGNGQVALTWSASPGASGYNLKRSPVSGGNYVTILSNTAATSYNDTGLTNWTACYYVVSALNAGGEGANSSEVSAQPQSPPISAEETGASSGILITGGTGIVIFKASVAGHIYQLQYSDSLAGGQWTDYGTAQPGTGSELIFAAPYDNTLPRRFYRIQIRQ
jgi:autotransporter-associated beta strand protein